MVTLRAHVANLRILAAADPSTTVFDLAVVNCLEELAEAVDGLRGRLQDDDPPDPPEHGFGTI
jgi:hypothetical protein